MITFFKKIARSVLVLVGLREPKNKKKIEEIPEKRPAPTEAEQRTIEAFRADVRALPQINQIKENATNPETERKWIDRQRKIRDNVLTRDPRDFFTWEEIKYSMLGQFLPHELEFIKKSTQWPLWKNALEETEFCEINKSWDQPYKSRATLISNAFKLAQLLINKNLNLREVKTILEFGGGYGSIARLCYKLGFRGTYIIFDLPEFSTLQKYFLSSSGLPLTIQYTPSKSTSNTVVLLSDIKQLEEQVRNTTPDIFIATWSLSESPVSLRKMIVNLLKNVKYFLIAYQEKFPLYNGVDNIDYFKKFQESMPGREWLNYPAKLNPKDFFLISKKVK